MALKGRLRDFSLAQLLNLVNLARKSGSLTIDAPQGHARLYFREGKLIHASLNGSEAGSDLAQLLTRAGKVTTDQIRALQAQGRARSDKELGLLLINAGFMGQAEILHSLRTHLLEIVYTIFTWDDGTFEFEQHLDPPAGCIAVPISLENIILEGRRRREELAELQTELPSLDVTLRFADGRGANLRNINLSVDEWRVISFINPRNTVTQIAQYNSMSEFQVRKIVSNLLREGLVEIVGTAAPAKSHPDLLGRSHSPTPLPEAAPKIQPAKVGKSIIHRLIARIRGL
ncbi:MAG: DUF4388 domain-containing protein [Ardenticatenaceae bacterium]|nr:DUF4388 domain-containing protein [Ardenticatenaceae bacterium]HBY93453.1 hypothetical protein [Chloroflexota bacterium]